MRPAEHSAISMSGGRVLHPAQKQRRRGGEAVRESRVLSKATRGDVLAWTAVGLWKRLPPALLQIFSFWQRRRPEAATRTQRQQNSRH